MFAAETRISSIRVGAFATLLIDGLSLPIEDGKATEAGASVEPNGTSAPVSAMPTKEFTEDEVTEAVKAIIAERTKDGVFTVKDSWTGTDLHIVFDEVRLVRGLQGHGWFPNVVFHDKDDSEKQYAVDFWLVPEGDQLKLMDVRVQKEPKPYG